LPKARKGVAKMATRLHIALFVGLMILSATGDAQPLQRANAMAQPHSATITGLTSEAVTVAFPDQTTKSIYKSDGISFVRNISIGVDDLKIGSAVTIRGRHVDRDKFLAFLLVQSSKLFADEQPTGAGDGALRGAVSGLNPLALKSLDGETYEIIMTPGLKMFQEIEIALDDLSIGAPVRMLPSKLVVLGNEPVSGGTGISNRKKPMKGLPVPPDVVNSDFSEKRFDEKKDSPFGIFDPNMLRFVHSSWFDAYPKIMNDLDVHWASFGASFSFNWNLICDPAHGELQWERFDKLIRHAHGNNINLIGYIKATAPASGRQDGQRLKPVIPSLPDDLQAYQKFVRQVVERYDKDGKDDMPGLKWPIKFWSVEDEPLSPKYFKGTGADYARLLHAAFLAIKEADPEAQVICSMIRGTGWHIKKNIRTFMSAFFKEMEKIGNRRPYDFMDQHWIGYDEQMACQNYTFYKDLMDDIDQTGMNHGFKPAPYMALELSGTDDSGKAQAIDLFKRHVILLSLGIQRILWSGLQAAPETGLSYSQINDYFRRVTLLDGDGQKKPAYHTYKLMVEKLDGADWQGTLFKKIEKGVSFFEFTRSNRPVWIVWNDTESPSAIQITMPDTIHQVEIMEVLARSDETKGAGDDGENFRKEIRAVNKTIIDLSVGEIPLIITGH
jgi:hypothetical protein